MKEGHSTTFFCSIGYILNCFCICFHILVKFYIFFDDFGSEGKKIQLSPNYFFIYCSVF